MLHNLRFFSSKCRLFHNATSFGSCIIHILNTGCVLKFKRKFRRQRVNSPSASTYKLTNRNKFPSISLKFYVTFASVSISTHLLLLPCNLTCEKLLLITEFLCRIKPKICYVVMFATDLQTVLPTRRVSTFMT